jgi:hypothetical protein
LTIENVADITAWLPTIEPRVAITNTGQKTGSAQARKCAKENELEMFRV